MKHHQTQPETIIHEIKKSRMRQLFGWKPIAAELLLLFMLSGGLFLNYTWTQSPIANTESTHLSSGVTYFGLLAIVGLAIVASSKTLLPALIIVLISLTCRFLGLSEIAMWLALSSLISISIFLISQITRKSNDTSNSHH